MATVKCALGKRGRPSHEWNDGDKNRIYCLGWVDPMTDDPLPECLACPDFVDKAQDDLEAFYRRADNGNLCDGVQRLKKRRRNKERENSTNEKAGM